MRSSEAKSQVLQRGTRPGLMNRWCENFGLCMYINQDSFWVTMDSKPHASTCAGDKILEARHPCVSKNWSHAARRRRFFFLRRTARTPAHWLSRSWSMFDCRMRRLRTGSWVSARCVARTTRAACLGTSVPTAVPRCGWMELKRPCLLRVSLVDFCCKLRPANFGGHGHLLSMADKCWGNECARCGAPLAIESVPGASEDSRVLIGKCAVACRIWQDTMAESDDDKPLSIVFSGLLCHTAAPVKSQAGLFPEEEDAASYFWARCASVAGPDLVLEKPAEHVGRRKDGCSMLGCVRAACRLEQGSVRKSSSVF